MVTMMRRPLFAGFGSSNEPMHEPSSLLVNRGRRHVDDVQIRDNQPKAPLRSGLGRSATVAGTRALRRPFTSSGSTEADSTSNRQSVLRVADSHFQSRILEEGANGGRATTSNGVPSAKVLVEAILGEPVSGEPIFGGHRIRNRNRIAAPTMLDQRSNEGIPQIPRIQRTEHSTEIRRISPESVPFEIPFEETRDQIPAVASLAAVMEMDRPAPISNSNSSNGNATGLTRSRSKWNPFSRSRSKSAKPPVSSERRKSRILLTNVQKSPYIARSVTELDRMVPSMTTQSFTHIGPTSPCWSTTNSTVEEKEEEDRFLQEPAAPFIPIAPVLNIDIPSYQLDRFSIMFGDLLDRGSTPPMQDACDGKVESFGRTNILGFQDDDEMPRLPRRATTPLPRSCSPAALSPPPSRESELMRAKDIMGAPALLRSSTTPVEVGSRLGVSETSKAQSGGLFRGASKRLVSRFNRHEHITTPPSEPNPIPTLGFSHKIDKIDDDSSNNKSNDIQVNDIKINNDNSSRSTLLPAAKIEEYPLRPSLDERSLRTKASTIFDDDDDDDENDNDDSKSIHENVQIFIARQVSVSRRPQRLVIPVNKLPSVGGPTSPSSTTPTDGTMLETPMTPKVVHLSSPRLSAYRRSTLVAVSEV